MDVASDVKLLGYSAKGPTPLGWVHVPTEPGTVQALYGQNGAGKSRMLSAIRGALTGVANTGGWSMLHVQCAEPDEFVDGEWRAELESALAGHLDEVRGRWWAELRRQEDAFRDYSGDVEEAQMDLTEMLFALQEGGDDRVDSLGALVRGHLYAGALPAGLPERNSLASDVGRAGLFTLLATGTDDRPSWRVFASAPSWSRALEEMQARESLYAQEHRELVSSVNGGRGIRKSY